MPLEECWAAALLLHVPALKYSFLLGHTWNSSSSSTAPTTSSSCGRLHGAFALVTTVEMRSDHTRIKLNGCRRRRATDLLICRAQRPVAISHVLAGGRAIFNADESAPIWWWRVADSNEQCVSDEGVHRISSASETLAELLGATQFANLPCR